MRILIAGDWHSRIHEEPMLTALRSLGQQVHRFAWYEYFLPSARRVPQTGLSRLVLRFQDRFLLGPRFGAVNRDLIAAAVKTRPDCLFVYRGTHITVTTLRAIKSLLPSSVLVGYNNDDPFSPAQPGWLWRHFLAAIPAYDLILAYRSHSKRELIQAGAKRVEVMRSWFVPELHRPMQLSADDRARFGSDIVFAGHYEPDGRAALLEKAAQRGYQVRVFGPGNEWDRILRNFPLLRHQAPTQSVWDDDYVKALNGSKVALCFLSKLNRDSYTRRCFEIPATGTLLVSEYSDDLASLFMGDVEAVFFSSPHELMCKLDVYLSDYQRRESVAMAGRRRVYADGHDVVSRMRLLLDWIEAIRGGSSPRSQAGWKSGATCP